MKLFPFALTLSSFFGPAVTPSAAAAASHPAVAQRPAAVAQPAVRPATRPIGRPGQAVHPLAHGALGARPVFSAHPSYAGHPLAHGYRPGEIYRPREGGYGGLRAAEPHREAFRDRAGYRHAINGARRYRAWEWHHGDPWAPNAGYWGGGFWGPVALGVAFGALVTVALDSPGHLVLENYGLVTIACNPNARQVLLYGPNGSVVCAAPDAMVQPGNYEIDPSSLELQPTTEE